MDVFVVLFCFFKKIRFEKVAFLNASARLFLHTTCPQIQTFMAKIARLCNKKKEVKKKEFLPLGFFLFLSSQRYESN